MLLMDISKAAQFALVGFFVATALAGFALLPRHRFSWLVSHLMIATSALWLVLPVPSGVRALTTVALAAAAVAVLVRTKRSARRHSSPDAE
jgi:hypothetical protein